MKKNRRIDLEPAAEERFLEVKRRKVVPHEFVLEALAKVSPKTRAMFGCLAVYVGEEIVMILRDKKSETKSEAKKGKTPRGTREGMICRAPTSVSEDNGVWLATTAEHHESLQREFPNMRSIRMFGKKVTGWQVLPADAADFEEAALRACDLVGAKDARIGKVPKGRRSSGAGKEARKRG